MNYKEIVDLIKLVNKTELTEVDIKEGEFKLKIRTKNYVKGGGKAFVSATPATVAYAQPAISADPVSSSASESKPAQADLKPAETATKGDDTANLLEVKSPIVGTFYRSSSPDKPAYAKVGDEISEGSVVCIVEAMKLFNEIESEVSGKIVKVMVEDASPVEYDQVLFLVDPS